MGIHLYRRGSWSTQLARSSKCGMECRHTTLFSLSVELLDAATCESKVENTRSKRSAFEWDFYSTLKRCCVHSPLKIVCTCCCSFDLFPWNAWFSKRSKNVLSFRRQAWHVLQSRLFSIPTRFVLCCQTATPATIFECGGKHFLLEKRT